MDGDIEEKLNLIKDDESFEIIYECIEKYTNKLNHNIKKLEELYIDTKEKLDRIRDSTSQYSESVKAEAMKRLYKAEWCEPGMYNPTLIVSHVDTTNGRIFYKEEPTPSVWRGTSTATEYFTIR